MFFALNYMHMAALVYEIQVVATTTTEYKVTFRWNTVSKAISHFKPIYKHIARRLQERE